jgi:hypothetical protein
MSSVTEVQEQNRTLARRINEEARADPASPYAGKKVGIANGQVVVVSDDWDDLASRLLQIEPDPRRTFCVEAGVDYDAVEEIWDRVESDPTSAVTIDLVAREVRVGPASWSFPLDDHSRWRLMEGLDDIGLTLRHTAEISAYEASRPSFKPAVA